MRRSGTGNAGTRTHDRQAVRLMRDESKQHAKKTEALQALRSSCSQSWYTGHTDKHVEWSENDDHDGVNGTP